MPKYFMTDGAPHVKNWPVLFEYNLCFTATRYLGHEVNHRVKRFRKFKVSVWVKYRALQPGTQNIS